MTEPPRVYGAISAVTAALAKDGIGKDRKNQMQGYNFRGIDDVYNALAPVLAANKLCVIPRMLARETVERTTQKGGILFYVTVTAQFDFVSAEDGTRHEVVTYGEAMDSADKATNKAMSAAYKYAAFMTFCIPTEGDNDADAVTHDVAPGKRGPRSYTPAPRTAAPMAVGMTTKRDNITDWVEHQRSLYEAALTIDAVDEITNAHKAITPGKTTSAGERLKANFPDLFTLLEKARLDAEERVIDAAQAVAAE